MSLCGGDEDPHWHSVGHCLQSCLPCLISQPPWSLPDIFWLLSVTQSFLSYNGSSADLEFLSSPGHVASMDVLFWMSSVPQMHKSVSRNSLNVPQRHWSFPSLSFPLISMAVSTLHTKVLLLKYTRNKDAV